MGRTTKSDGALAGQFELFDEDLGHRTARGLYQGRMPNELGVLTAPPPQTDAKSKLIAEYITLFQKVTKGGLYIDGFAAPQSREHPEAWTARRVLEIEPKRLRTFWLCDIDKEGLSHLGALKGLHHRKPTFRRVFVYDRDFNVSVTEILKSDRLTRAAAIFALLDQRNTECHWATVQALANRAGRTKIELLYFLGTSWMHRSLSQSKTADRLAEIEAWWGNPDWRSLIKLSQPRIVDTVVRRFIDELRYKHVTPYAIRQEDGGKALFYLIHASDHPEAPKLMGRAYRSLYNLPEVDQWDLPI